jgi:ribosome-interacting GTPase 1
MALETFGSIIKEENVKTVERGILPNTFVLENLGSFPGYYGAQIPINRNPDSIFLVLTKKESTEKILRITHDIKKKTKLLFEGTPASLCVHNTTYQTIRLRHLKEFDHIAEIQEYYRDYGISFAKTKKLEESSLIQVKKIFQLEWITDRILKDLEDDMYYLKINEQLNWSHFKKVTTQVRNNLHYSAYDAALAVIYGVEVLDLVRIYSTTFTREELETLHNKYDELIAQSLK